MRQNWLSNRVFETYDEVVEGACDAWQKLIAQPESNYSPPLRWEKFNLISHMAERWDF